MDIAAVRVVDQITPITRATDASDVALAAYGRLIGLLERLDAEAWRAPTECEGWDVAAMVGHLIGAAKAGASLRENARQQYLGKRRAASFDGNTLDAANDVQVTDHVALSPEQRVAELRRVAPPAVRGRMRLPGLLRRLSVPLDQGGSTAAGMPARLRLGHLVDVIYTRDVWLHTVDIARAAGVPFVADAKLDGRIVEDVVAEWAARHGQPFELTLTGHAGGRFRQGSGGGALQLDAVEFCRVLSGRAAAGTAEGLDAETPEVAKLLETRVLF